VRRPFGLRRLLRQQASPPFGPSSLLQHRLLGTEAHLSPGADPYRRIGRLDPGETLHPPDGNPQGLRSGRDHHGVPGRPPQLRQHWALVQSSPERGQRGLRFSDAEHLGTFPIRERNGTVPAERGNGSLESRGN